MKTKFLFLSILILSRLLITAQPARPNYVYLGKNQTPIKDQGSRGTCITFAAIAALEAAYKKAGYSEVILSEEFLNYLGKTFWLHPKWNEVLARGNDGSETQVAAFSGGGGVGYINMLAHGMKVPENSLMPYRHYEYTARDFAPLSHDWTDPYWNKQKNMSDFNLRFITQSALTADKYYSVREFKEINGRDVNAIETALAAGKEVVWDMDGAFPDGPYWDTSSTCAKRGAHAMLIIGYDRRDPNPKGHYFIIKNSWGKTSLPDGYQRATYDYVKTYGTDAGYIESINPPEPWPELAFIGRWKISYDGHVGLLDIYHIPHIAEIFLRQYGVTSPDNRLGTFYDPSGKAYKVNGSVTGTTINFYVDFNNPDARWDVLNGSSFSYSLINEKQMFMAGSQRDPDGKIYGGYAGKQATGISFPLPHSFLGSVVNTRSYIGRWRLTSKGSGFLFDIIQFDAATTASYLTGHDYDGFLAVLIDDVGVKYDAKFFVEKANTNHVIIQVPHLYGEYGPDGGYATGWLFNFDKGMVAGTTYYNNGYQLGFSLDRLSQQPAQLESPLLKQTDKLQKPVIIHN